MERLMSVKELAEAIGLSPATIYALVVRREIPVQRVRRRVMFARGDRPPAQAGQVGRLTTGASGN